MFRFAFLSFCLIISAGYVKTQSIPDLTGLPSTLLKNNDLMNVLQSPEVATKLIGLLNNFNKTGNISFLVDTVVKDATLSALLTAAAEAVFESLTKPAMSNNNVNKACQDDVVMFLEGLAKGNDWALKMIDAMGKPGSNLADQQTKFIGSFDECLDIKAVWTDAGPRQGHSFDGKYCSAIFKLPGLPPSLLSLGIGNVQLGLCVPNTCSGEDVKVLIEMGEKALLNNTEPYPPNMYCAEDFKKEIGSDGIVAITILGLLACLVVFGTLYDVVAIQMKPKDDDRKPGNTNDPNGPVILTHSVYKIAESNGDKSSYTLNEQTAVNGESIGAVKVPSGPKERSSLEKVLLAFSVYTNGVKLLGTKQSGSLGAVNGIRFLSMAWVILGHSYFFAARYDANFFQHASKKRNQWTFMAIIYADVSVDSFFTLSGLLVAYLTLTQFRKLGSPRKMNWLMYYFHRFWRLTPPYMLVMMVGTVIMPYTLDGPFWNNIEYPAMSTCRDNWWTNLLYVNNYVKPDEMCMGWSWYLADDMQYYWISPLLLIPLFFNVIGGSVVCVLLLLASAVTTGVITHEHRYPAQLFSGFGDPPKDGDYTKNLYYPSYARIGPYVVGVFTGYLLYRWKCRCRIPKYVNLAGWLLSIITCVVIVYVRYSKDGNHVLPGLDTEVFMSIHRTVWALALCWMIFSCATGHGGWINEVLSWKPFIPLGRLSYCAYLIHPIVMFAFYSSRRVPTYFTDYEVIYMFLAHITMTYGLAFITSLFFESPMMGLEKVIFNRGKK